MMRGLNDHQSAMHQIQPCQQPLIKRHSFLSKSLVDFAIAEAFSAFLLYSKFLSDILAGQMLQIFITKTKHYVKTRPIY
jgi:hypothetical protein